jgi:hypothetical protein
MAIVSEQTIKDVITDFLASAPSLDAIIAYQLPEPIQERAHLLLDKNRAGDMTSEEQAEMAEFRNLDHLMTLIKVKAKLKQQGKL